MIPDTSKHVAWLGLANQLDEVIPMIRRSARRSHLAAYLLVGCVWSRILFVSILHKLPSHFWLLQIVCVFGAAFNAWNYYRRLREVQAFTLARDLIKRAALFVDDPPTMCDYLRKAHQALGEGKGL